MTDRWMHPAIWWLLLFAAPPVWGLLMLCRFFSKIMAALGIVFAGMFCFWLLAAGWHAATSSQWQTAGHKIIYERLQ